MFGGKEPGAFFVRLFQPFHLEDIHRRAIMRAEEPNTLFGNICKFQ